MKNIFKILILAVMAFSIGSCYNDTFPEDTEPDPVGVSYSKDIQPMWDTDCVSCHPTTAPPDLREGTSYNSLLKDEYYVIPGDAANSILYQSLLGSNGVSLMPTQGMWPASSIKTVETWINEGAKNN